MQTIKPIMLQLDLALLHLPRLSRSRFRRLKFCGHKNQTVADLLVVDLQLHTLSASAVERNATMRKTSPSLKENETSARELVMLSQFVEQRRQQLLKILLHHRFLSSTATHVLQICNLNLILSLSSTSLPLTTSSVNP